MSHYYTDEENAQIIIALLKIHGIRKVIASPGTTNMPLVVSMSQDPFFQMFSVVDERSAAYMACGLASETGEAVVITCTGATASRNYSPGLTEAFYRKLPVLAITSTQAVARVGHLVAQVIDRSVIQNDVARYSVNLPIVKDSEDRWECEISVNRAILELYRHGGGPVHINLPTRYSKVYDIRQLPDVRIINRIRMGEALPPIPSGKVAVLIGAHQDFTDSQTSALDKFCLVNNAVVFCDHTSGYKGAYRVPFALPGCQDALEFPECSPDLLIHIGEVSGDYYNSRCIGKQVWRINEDGEIRDPFRKLRYIFEMPHRVFFEHYGEGQTVGQGTYLRVCRSLLEMLRDKLPELPFSHIWMASKMASRIPNGSTIHFGILNSLRAWNFFDLPASVKSMSNVGGFGIDGSVSTILGASLSNPSKLYFCALGDLAFFYDLNAIGNRHLGKNLRILLVNNGKGTEFRLKIHPASQFGVDADKYVAAGGHFGNKSPTLVKQYAQNLGFEYLSAVDKSGFETVCERFLTPEITDRPMLFEVFTDSDDECDALEVIMNVEKNVQGKAKQLAKQILGD